MFYLVDLVLDCQETGRNLYETPLEEPALFRRYVKKWIAEGIQERALSDKLRRDELGL